MPTKKRRLEALYESEANMEGGGFFQNLLKRVFIGVSDMIVRPTGFVPSQIKYGWLNRPIDMPPLEDLAKMVASTYNPEGSNDPAIQGYTRVLKTPTLTVFRVNRKRNIFIYALRGTAFTDINDITADLGIVRSIVEDASTARNVRNSSRYANDVADIKEFDGLVKDYFRVDNPIYFGVGHSLSGAIIDELLEDGYISSAVSFNPAIERKDFNSPNDNHRIYLECDVLYNLLGKYITNGNLEVIPMKNPRGEDAGTIDTTKGSIECHNIKTVIPLMSGKGINNNVGLMYKPPMDFFEKRETYPECEEILRQPVTQDVGVNSGRERQKRAYNECVARKGVKVPEKSICDDPRYIGMECRNRRPPSTFQDLINNRSRPDFRPIGSGLFDTIIGNLGKSISDQASQGNILGRIKDSMDKGAALRKAEQEKEWSGGLLGKIGIPNPMKLFGGNQEMEGEGVMGDLWRSGAKTIREYSGMKEPEYKSTPLFDYTDRDAVEDRFYGERTDAPSKVGRQNMRVFGRGRPYTADEWEAKLCKGEDSLLEKKKRAISARAEKKKGGEYESITFGGDDKEYDVEKWNGQGGLDGYMSRRIKRSGRVVGRFSDRKWADFVKDIIELENEEEDPPYLPPELIDEEISLKRKKEKEAQKKVKVKLVRKVRDEPEEEEMPEWFKNALTEKAFKPDEEWDEDKMARLRKRVEIQQKTLQDASAAGEEAPVLRQLNMLLNKAKKDVEGYLALNVFKSKAPTKEPDEYVIGDTGGNLVYMTPSQLESQTTRETFIRMLRSNGAFKSQAADTKLYNQMKRADAKEMASILRSNMDKVEYFTRQKFFKDFAREAKRR